MDIVNRLRGWLLDDPIWGKGVDLSITYDDVKEAADEIEKLQQALLKIINEMAYMPANGDIALRIAEKALGIKSET